VYSGRAESYDKMADLVTLRAVEQFERVLAVAARLVKREERVELGTGPLSEEDAPAESGEKTGRLALLIGATQHESARKALPHYCWENPIPIPLSSERILLVGRPAE
jgi:16S rRNA G527 N7-methylase RsmG